MKKLIMLLTIIALVITTTVGCAPKVKTPPPTDTEIEKPADTIPDTTPDTTTPGAGATLQDGTFDAKGEPDDKGYTGQIQITVAGGKITTVDYDEVSADGKAKSEDEEYAVKYKEVSGMTPKEVYEKLKADLIEKQDPNAVEMISKATNSSEQFKKLAEEAMKSTKK